MDETYPIATKPTPTFYFIGVTTARSSIRRVFPRWMAELGRPDILLEGIDLKIHDEPHAYRAATAQIKQDTLSIGALVTTHKIDLYEAARDMFDYLDPYALLCGELSSISKLEGRLEGHAKDPISAGRTLDTLLGEGYFGRTGAHVLIFGAGGSAVATALHLINKVYPADRPARITLVNRSAGRLARAREMVSQLNTDIDIEYVCNQDPVVSDQMMASLPAYSVVINATGMGKDTPGSPITDEGLFPRHGVAWEFNYRGELDFMHQALRQVQSRDVTVEDGWLYFVHGWTQVVAQVLHIDLTPDLFRRLEQVAAAERAS
jgi:shikimate 5-dehydrogenase